MCLQRSLDRLMLLIPAALLALPAWSAPPADNRARTPLADIPAVQAEPEAAGELSDEQAERLEEARRLFSRQQWAGAVQILDALREQAGGVIELEWLAAQAHAYLRDDEQALAAARRVIALEPQHADANVLAAGVLLRRGDRAAALPHLRAATLAADREVNNVSVTHAWWLLGRTLQAEGYLAAAAEALAQFDAAIQETHTEHRNAPEIAAVLEAHPRGAFDQRVELYTALEQWDAQLALTESGLRRWPDDPAVQRAHVRALSSAQRPREAFDFTVPRLDDPSGRAAFLDLAVQAAAQAEAIDEWVARLAAGPLEGDRLERAAAVAAGLHAAEHSGAAATLGRAVLAADPRRTGMVVLVAEALAVDGNERAAIELLAEHIRTQPGHGAWSRRDLDRVAALLGAARDAERLLADLADRDGPDLAAHFLSGLQRQSVGDRPGARERFAAAAAAAADSGFTGAHIAITELLAADYDWESLRQYAERLLARAPKLAVAHYALARACAGLDEHEQAEAALREAVRHDEHEPAYALALAEFYRERGDALSSAQRYFRQALELDPTNGQAFEGLIDSYLREGKRELARAEFERLRGSGVAADALRRVQTTLRFLDAPYGDAHMEELARQSAEHPQDARTLWAYAVGLFRNGDYRRAAETMRRARALAPDDYELAVQAAQMLRLQAMLPETVEILEQLRARYPKRRRLAEMLAVNYICDFRADEGRALLRELLESSQDEPDRYRSMLVESYSAVREFDEALALLDGWLKESPDDRALQFMKVQTLGLAERFDEAYALAHERVQASPGDPFWEEILRHTAGWADKYDDVIALARAAAKRDESRAEVTDRLIDLLLEAGRHAEALEVAQEYEGSFNDQTLRRIWLGRCHAAAGDVSLCIREFEALLSERTLPADHKPVVQAAFIEALRGAEAYDEALERLDRWLAEDPRVQERMLVWKRDVLVQADAPLERQIAVMEALLPLARDDTRLNNDLGYSWADLGLHIEQAEEMIRFAVGSEGLSPLNPAYVDSLGWVLYKKGDFAGARKYLERAATLIGEGDAVIPDHLGDACWRLGDRQAARRHWQAAADTLRAADEPSPRDRKLAEQVRAKLEASEARGDSAPPIAPTAAEQHGGSESAPAGNGHPIASQPSGGHEPD